MRLHYIYTFSALALSLPLRGAEVVIASTPKRAVILEKAEQLTKPALTPLPTAKLKNPFALSNLAETVATVAQPVAKPKIGSDRELLEILVAQLDPKGSLKSSQGESFIRLGQRMVKVGEKIPINFDGAVYEIEIISVDGTRFTTRYKNEELTKAIIPKAGKNP